MIRLRDYQQNLYAKIEQSWRAVRRVLAVCPTGGGKTVLFSQAIHDHNGASAAVVHRKEIVAQISLALGRLEVKHRIVAPPSVVTLIRRKHLREFNQSFIDQQAPCGVISVQTLTSKSSSNNKPLQTWLKQVTLAVFDECFPAGTLVDEKPIETIKIGDLVTAYDEKKKSFIKKKVTHVFKRKSPDVMVRIDFAGHQYVHCTPNHPFYTKRGWVNAGELNAKTDQVLYVPPCGNSREAAREREVQENGTGVLQPRMQPSVSIEKEQRSCVKNEHALSFGPNETQQPYGASRSTRKSVKSVESYRAPARSTGWKRQRGDKSGKNTVSTFFWTWFYKPIDRANRLRSAFWRATDALQNRLRKCDVKNSDRSRRQQSRGARTSTPRRKEGRVSTWARVDRVTFYERNSTGSPPGSLCDGNVYNLEVEDHHTYIANGVVVHNCHHYTSGGLWGRAVKMLGDARMLFVTATPERADGQGLGEHADGFVESMVEGPTTQWLIEQGYLSKFRYVAPSTDLDVSGLAKSASGDFTSKALRNRVVESHLVGDVVDHYKRFAAGKRTIVFATDVETAHEIAATFQASGHIAVALSGKTEQAERDREIERFSAGETDILVNVDLFDEGFDVPAVECVILARPTESLGKFLQMVGRALRCVFASGYDLSTVEGRLAAMANGNKPEATIIDPVRNWERHGMPNWPRNWTLDAKPTTARSNGNELVPQRICLRCTQPYEKFYKACPHCGEPVPEPAGRSAPEQVEGDLTELDVDAMAALFKQIDSANMDDDDYALDQIKRHIPKVGRGADMTRHQTNKARRAVLKELIAWWVGLQEGRELGEIHRRFYLRFGVDIGTAMTLKANDTDALIARIEQRFTEDLIDVTK